MLQDPSDLDEDAIREQLQRMLTSCGFDASARNRRFLQYIVDETLADRGERIKAYSIATAVFGRGDDFDPQLDSIVRIEAGRLRRSMERYYLTSGASDPVRIAIPKGSYVPSFERAEAHVSLPSPAPLAARLPDPAAFWNRPGPAILVEAFEQDGDQSAYPNLTRGFTRHVIAGLTRFADLVVFGPEAMPDGDRISLTRLRAELGVDLLLTGGASLVANRFCVEVLLIDARTGRYVWAETFERDVRSENAVDVRDEIANSLVRTLAQPYGIIWTMTADAAAQRPDRPSAYQCVLRFYEYSRHFDRALFDPLLIDLERVIADEPRNAEAHACLSQLYTDAFRYGLDIAAITTKPLERALALAHRAVDLAPRSSRGQRALATAYWLNGDVDGSLAALETGLGLNRNDTDIVGELGLRYALRAQWDKALPLLERAYAGHPAQPGTFRVGLALHHYLNGRFDRALAEARRIDAPQVLYGHVLVAIAAARLGATAEAEEAVARILSLDPLYGAHVEADLQVRNVHPDIVRAVIDGLGKAGLPGIPAEVDQEYVAGETMPPRAEFGT